MNEKAAHQITHQLVVHTEQAATAQLHHIEEAMEVAMEVLHHHHQLEAATALEHPMVVLLVMAALQAATVHQAMQAVPQQETHMLMLDTPDRAHLRHTSIQPSAIGLRQLTGTKVVRLTHRSYKWLWLMVTIRASLVSYTFFRLCVQKLRLRHYKDAYWNLWVMLMNESWSLTKFKSTLIRPVQSQLKSSLVYSSRS